MSSPYSISKSSFLKFEQCEKAFFLYKNHPYLRDKLTIEKQLTFKRGHDVGFFARQLFPGGIDVAATTKGAQEAWELTRQHIEVKTPVIYEATFVYNDVLVMADILCYKNGQYIAYEVKSSLKVSELYIKDACLQYYVMKNCLPELNDMFLVTLNGDYVLQGQMDVRKLFKKRSVKTRAEANMHYFEHQINSARLVLERNAIPNTGIGKQCFRPYQCDFFGNCWKDKVSEDSIFQLPFIDRGKLLDWHDRGFTTIAQLDDLVLEKERNIRLKEAFLLKKPVVNHERISRLLARVESPFAAMDMEIWNPAIPQVQGSRPFEQIPFLVSFYDGSDFTFKFVNEPGIESEDFARSLVEMSAPFRSILVYDRTLEQNVIARLCEKYPDLKNALATLSSKLIDIGEVFIEMAYYDPAFRNNLSLKTVAAALLPPGEPATIGSGLEAMGFYEQFRHAANGIEKDEMRSQLIAYCNTDCLLTYNLHNFLLKNVQQKSP